MPRTPTVGMGPVSSSSAGDVPDGHVETDWLVYGETQAAAKRALHGLTLHDLKLQLDRAVEAQREEPDW
jgi:hypothetical protein